MALVLAAPAQSADTLRGSVWIEEPFADAQALAVDVAGRVYVADPGAGALFVFTSSGATHAKITGGSDAASTLREPVDVDPTNGLLLYVADAGAGRIFPIGRDGFFLEPLGGDTAPRTGTFDEPADVVSFLPRAVATTVRGDVLAVDGAQPRVLRWDASRRRTVFSGEADAVLADPRGIAVMDDHVFVLDRDGVARFDALGTHLGTFGRAFASLALRVRRLGDSVALVLPDRLVVFSREGRLEGVHIWSGPPLRDAALSADGLVLLTARALYRVER